MSSFIETNAKTEWMLVKVRRIRDDEWRNVTAKHLRYAIRENHFGGESASVRKLTAKEVLALEVASRKPISYSKQEAS